MLMSPLGISTTVDAIQTAAIITLIFAIVFLVRRSDKRFGQQHTDVQDVIRSQYEILGQIREHQSQLDLLGEKLAKCEKRTIPPVG